MFTNAGPYDVCAACGRARRVPPAPPTACELVRHLEAGYCEREVCLLKEQRHRPLQNQTRGSRLGSLEYDNKNCDFTSVFFISNNFSRGTRCNKLNSRFVDVLTRVCGVCGAARVRNGGCTRVSVFQKAYFQILFFSPRNSHMSYTHRIFSREKKEENVF